jgi:hypothetical protein
LKRTTLIAKMNKLGISRPVRGEHTAGNVAEFQSSAVNEVPWEKRRSAKI